MTSILPILSYTYSGSDAYVNGISNYTTEIWTDFDGTLTIPSTTTDSGFTYSVVGINFGALWFNYSDSTGDALANFNANYPQILTIILPSTITQISELAIGGLSYLSYITTDTSINDTSYSTIPIGVTSLNQNVLSLTAITSFIIPYSVTSVGLQAFASCTSLTNLEIYSTSLSVYFTDPGVTNDSFNDVSLNYLLCTSSSGITYTYESSYPYPFGVQDPTLVIYTFYNSSGIPSGWVPTAGYSYPKYVYSDIYGGSGMSFTTSYNSTDASNTYISSTYGNVAINAFDSTNSIYLGRTDCSSNVNSNLGNTVNDVYVGGNLTVDGSLNLTGTLSSSGPAFIYGSVNSPSWQNYGNNENQYGYLNSNGTTGMYSTTNYMITDATFGLVVYGGRILCSGEIDCFSDIRIKQNILDINTNNALDIVRMLKPKTYSYIDTNKNNQKINYGFIAQEVDNVFSDAIMKKQVFIPNIYDIGEVINKNTIKLNNKFTSDFEIKDNKNIKIKLFFINDKEKIVNLKEIIDDKIFTIDENLGDQPVVFVYGQEVEDFHIMEKNAIFTLTTSAVKQLDTELKETKKIINNQQQEINELKKQVNEVIKLISIK